jgi:uncharacterized protein (TIRG00374 family)
LIKKILIPLVKILISIVLVVFLLAKLGLRDIVDQFATANFWWILAGVLAFALSNILGSLQWYLLMKTQGIEIPLLKAISYYHVGLFFNNFLIGYVGGDAIRIYDISKVSGNSSHAISTVFFDRLIGFVMLTTLALVAGIAWRNIFHSKTVIFIILIIFICWIISFIVLFNKRFAQKIGWIFQFVFPRKIKNKIKEIYSSINSFKHEKKILIKVLIVSVIVQTFRILVHFFAALSVGIHAHIQYFFIFVPVIALLSSLPISIGGIGIRESSGVALFSQINSFQPQAIVAMEFLAYIIGLLSTLPGGLIFILRKEKLQQNNRI